MARVEPARSPEPHRCWWCGKPSAFRELAPLVKVCDARCEALLDGFVRAEENAAMRDRNRDR